MKKNVDVKDDDDDDDDDNNDGDDDDDNDDDDDGRNETKGFANEKPAKTEQKTSGSQLLRTQETRRRNYEDILKEEAKKNEWFTNPKNAVKKKEDRLVTNALQRTTK